MRAARPVAVLEGVPQRALVLLRLRKGLLRRGVVEAAGAGVHAVAEELVVLELRGVLLGAQRQLPGRGGLVAYDQAGGRHTQVGLVGRGFVGPAEGRDGRLHAVAAGGHGDRERLDVARAEVDERITGDDPSGGQVELPSPATWITPAVPDSWVKVLPGVNSQV